MQNHPLTEISSSPGHLLLLKLFHHEEDLSALRVAALQTRLDTAKRDAFHGLSLTLLFTASINTGDKPCRNWGVPSFLILLTSLVLVCVVQVKVTGYWRAVQKMVKEKEDGRALARCVQELRMKGVSFHLSKEPVTGKRIKSSSVEVKWRPIQLFKENMEAYLTIEAIFLEDGGSRITRRISSCLAGNNIVEEWQRAGTSSFAFKASVDNEALRELAAKSILERNPKAFKPKVVESSPQAVKESKIVI